MPRRNGPWRVISTRTIHSDSFITVTQDRVVRPDGRPGRYALVRMKPGVVVLPVEEDGTVVLVRQFRYGIGRTRLEAVSGGIDGRESPRQAARRELREETGIRARKLVPFGELEMDGSIILNHNHLFLAEGLKHGPPERESTEEIELVICPLREALRMVQSGTIDHGPTSVLILKAARTCRIV